MTKEQEKFVLDCAIACKASTFTNESAYHSFSSKNFFDHAKIMLIEAQSRGMLLDESIKE